MSCDEFKTASAELTTASDEFKTASAELTTGDCRSIRVDEDGTGRVGILIRWLYVK